MCSVCPQVSTGGGIHRHHPGRPYSEGSISARLVGIRAERVGGEQKPAAPDQRDRAPQRRQEVHTCFQRTELPCGLKLFTVLTSVCLSVSRSPGDALETFNFLENAEDSDEEEDEEGDLMDDIATDKHHRAKKHKTKV